MDRQLPTSVQLSEEIEFVFLAFPSDGPARAFALEQIAVHSQALVVLSQLMACGRFLFLVVPPMEQQFFSVKEDINSMKEDINGMKEDINSINQRLDKMENDVDIVKHLLLRPWWKKVFGRR